MQYLRATWHTRPTRCAICCSPAWPRRSAISPPHINTERVASDLALVRWAAERQGLIDITPQDRREVAEAVQRLNGVVFDSPDAPDPAGFEQDRISLERSTAELCAAAGRWLEQSDVTGEEESA